MFECEMAGAHFNMTFLIFLNTIEAATLTSWSSLGRAEATTNNDTKGEIIKPLDTKGESFERIKELLELYYCSKERGKSLVTWNDADVLLTQ